MDRFSRLSSLMFGIAFSASLTAATDENFDGIAGSGTLPIPFVRGDFTFEQGPSGGFDALAGTDAIANGTGPGNNNISFKTTDGSEFQLISFQLAFYRGDYIYRIEGYRDGVLIGSEIFDLTTAPDYTFMTFTVAGSDFDNVDEIRIENNQNNEGFIEIYLDTIDVEPAILPAAAPVIGNLDGDSFTYTEGDGAQIIDQGTAATVTDADSADFSGGNLTLTITSGEDAAEDRLSIDTSGSISLAGTTAGSNVSVGGTVVGTLGNNIAAGNDLVINFSANATAARTQTLVRALSYENSDTDNPTTGARNLRLTVNDGDGSSSNNDITVTVAASNDVPALSNLNGDSLSYQEDDGKVVLDQGTAVTLSDVDSADFNGGNLTVTITSGEDAGEDTLSVDTGSVTLGGTTAGSSVTVSATIIGTLGNNITAGNDFVVNFNANATVARIQSLLRALTYANSDTLMPTPGARNVRITVSDGDAGTSANQDLTVTVSQVNDLPTAANNSLNVNEGAATAIATSEFGYSDPEGSDLDHVTISQIPASGTLWLDSDGNGSHNGAETLVSNGSTVSKATLDSNLLTFMPSGTSSASLTFTVNDGSDDSSGSYTLTLSTNAQPTVTINQGASQADPTNVSAVVFDLIFSESVSGLTTSDISVSGDVSASVTGLSGSGSSYQATVTISSGNGDLLVSLPAGVVTDAGGASNKAATSTDNRVSYDGIAPAAPTGLDLVAAFDSGSSDSDNLTKLTTLSISGNGETGATLTLFADSNDNDLLDGGEITTSTTVSASTWTASLGTLTETTHAIKAYQTDAAGNDSAISAPLSVEVDATAPSGHSLSFSQNPVIAANKGAITLTFAAAETGAEFSYTIGSDGGGTPLTGSGTLASATDSIGPLDLSSLGDGTLTLSTVVTDAAGNAATTATDTATKDTEIPLAPTGLDLATASDSGSSDSDNLTKQTTVTIAGSGETGATLTLFVDSNGNDSLDGGEATATTSVSGGGWSTALGPLTQGSHNLKAYQTDAVGNQSAVSTPLTIEVDTEAPSGHSIVFDPTTVNGSNAQSVQVRFSGAEIGSLAAYSIASSGGGTPISGNATLASATEALGPFDLTTLTDGTLTASATLSDAAGNAATTVNHTADKDTQAPSGYSVNIDQAQINAANVGALSFTFSGGEATTHYQYSLSSSGGSAVVTGSGTLTGTGDQITGIDVSGLSDGTLTLSVTLTDALGNAGTAAVDTVAKDAVGPVIQSLVLNQGQFKAGGVITLSASFDDVVVLTGSNITASLTIGSDNRQAAYVSGHNSSTLQFSYTVQAGDNDNDGVTVTAIQTNGDFARDGNDNDAVLSFTAQTEPNLLVDTQAPAAATPEQAAQVLNSDSLTLSQTGYSEEAITIALLADANGDGIADNSTPLASDTVNGGHWSLDVALNQNADHYFVLRSSDAAGNSTDRAIGNYQEDSTLPESPLVLSPLEDLYTATPQVALQGSHSENGITLILLADSDNNGVADNDTAIATTTVSGNLWQFDLTLADNQVSDYVVQAKDDADNRSAQVGLVSLTHDDIAPTATLDTGNTATATPMIGGDYTDLGGIASLSYTLTDQDGQQFGPFNADSLDSGRWQDDAIGQSLGDGVYDAELTPVDKAGNSQVIALAQILTVDTQAPADYSVDIVQNRIDADNETAMSFIISGGQVGFSYQFQISDDNAQTIGDSGTLSAAEQAITNLDVSALAEGTLTLSLTLTDDVGNQGADAQDTVLKQYNAAPVLSGTPATSVDEDSLYQFQPQLIDTDAGDSHLFNISGLPIWASFNSANGTLSGTPDNSHVGLYSDIVIGVTDASGASDSLPAFSIEVVNTNDQPISADLTLTTQEDQSLLLPLVGQDDDGDALSFRLVSAPTQGLASLLGQQWHYEPETDFHGDISFTMVASDGKQDSSPFTVRIQVLPVNDLPVAVDDDFELDYRDDGQYRLAVMENDSDVDNDTLTLLQTSTTLGNAHIDGDALVLNLDNGFSGKVALQYLLSDGQGEPVEASVQVSIGDTDNAGLPILTLPEPVEVQADALFTRVDLGVATALDSAGTPLAVSLIRGHTLFQPGLHQVYWETTDNAGQQASASQVVKVHPMVNFHKDQLAAEGNTIPVGISLNGDAVSYPVTLALTLSGTAVEGEDYLISANEVQIDSGRHTSIELTLLDDGLAEGDETILIGFGDNINAGSRHQHQVVITDANLPPALTLSAQQSSEMRIVLAQDQGEVQLMAQASDPNPGDSLTLDWHHDYPELVDTDYQDHTLSFDPAMLAPGSYRIEASASDGEWTVEQSLTLTVVETLANLGEEDSDGDLLPDNLEGYGDDDNDGIANYLDALDDCNLQPEQVQQQAQYLFEGEAGICLRSGDMALGGIRNSAWLDEQDPLPADDQHRLHGGTFDFIAVGLPQLGQAYRLVLPQREAIPANAVYRKYRESQGWYDFVEDQNNQVHSAQGEPGYCPPPGSALWQPGLNEGSWCVQLTLTDGGPNDADGVANHRISDPGGVAVPQSSNLAPQLTDDAQTMIANTRLLLTPLANDSDPDGDTLVVMAAQATHGQLTLHPDGTLTYQPPADFLGEDRIGYSVSDGMGETATAQIVVTVVANDAPLAITDYASTDDRTAITVDVLANDQDPNNDSLALIWAEAEHGQVSITPDHTLWYQPQPGYQGEDRVTYRIQDALGSEAEATLIVTVDAHEPIVVTQTSSGGALSLSGGVLLSLLMLLRRRRALLALLSTTAIASTAQAQWSLHLQSGYSHTDSDTQSITAALEAAGVQVASLSQDTDTWSWGAELGYRFLPQWQLRVGFQDLGEYRLSYRGTTLDPESTQQQLATLGPTSASGVNLGLHYRWSFTPDWAINLGGGAWFWDSDMDSVSALQTLSSSDSGTDWFSDLNLSWQLNPNWSLAAGWQHFELDNSDIDNGFVRLNWVF
ncbi:Ig-like domain-containing protein [Ferrimonas sp. SCSIO 43195]|uniref:Ig-like domain-containing protein n=1 Tax=Ferrimonas sp. SCSIO 43195 TaxID=2822844 RepID=UPI002075DB25|nr:Ig-like domain-containing protein [Ferrimonas sp. SCSIO 43195]USD39152.1 tandem-95 repeat protein [Ferrimonas sp. SCSIO 43195]